MPQSRTQSIGGMEFLDLALDDAVGNGPRFLSARLIPARGLMLLQTRARLADGREIDVLAAPPPAEAARVLDGGPGDFMGNAAFSFGAAVLAPYANRIRGTYSAHDRTVTTRIGGRELRLPANGGGKAAGAEQYAIHGLILASAAAPVRVEQEADAISASGRIEAGDFGVGWPSATLLELRWTLRSDELSLQVTARNIGEEALPIGIGWHPYFALPSGAREQARMRVPARSRIVVNDYDEVLPTGVIEPVGGTRFDFRAAGGAQLGGAYLDDCFVDLERNAAGETVSEVVDPAGGHGVRITASSPEVSAIQTFAPPDRALIVIEPQFNWANPYGSEWGPGRDTGMALIEPGGAIEYRVRLEVFMP